MICSNKLTYIFISLFVDRKYTYYFYDIYICIFLSLYRYILLINYLFKLLTNINIIFSYDWAVNLIKIILCIKLFYSLKDRVNYINGQFLSSILY